MGNAEPFPSPAAANPDGRVVPYPAIADMEMLDDGTLGIYADGTLRTGSLDAVTTGGSTDVDLGTDCGDVTANVDGFVAVCGGDVRVIADIEGTSFSDHSFTPDEPVTAATLLAGGNVLAGSADTERVWVYDRHGKKTQSFKVARPSDFVLARMQTPEGESGEQFDRAVRINRFDTTIQDLQVDKGRQGGTLRVGLGVGQAAFGDDGMVLASDSTGGQLFVYTTDEVIRLHQTVPTDPHPWAVAWDPKRKLAWITSTEMNTVTGYDLSQGVPVEKLKFNTVADARNIAVLDDGTLLIASASGDGLQIISS